MNSQPLGGRRILVTRAPHQASELADGLRALGATPVLIPTIEIAPPASFEALDTALGDLASFDVVAFTSANAVQAFLARAQQLRISPQPRRIAAVGRATQRALEAARLRTDVVPPVFTAESLAETLRPEAPGRSFLLVLGDDAAPTLRDTLLNARARVTVATAYSNRIPAGSASAIASLFANPASYPDAITFTSASTASNLVALLAVAQLTMPRQILRASIGPVTSRALAELGLAAHIEAHEATIPALVDCIAARLGQS